MAPKEENWMAPKEENWMAPKEENWMAPKEENWMAPKEDRILEYSVLGCTLIVAYTLLSFSFHVILSYM